jgi:hypothetical protein
VPVTIDTTTVKRFVLKTSVSTECSLPEDKIGINRLRNTAGKGKILESMSLIVISFMFAYLWQ